MASSLSTTRPWALLALFVATRLLLAEAARSLEQAAPTAVATAPGAAGGTAGAAGGTAPAAAPSTQDADAALLLAFRATFDNGDNILPDWRPGSDPCAWKGISCTGGNVTGIVSGVHVM